MKGGSTTQSTAGCRNECSYISHHRNVKHYITDNTRPYPTHELVKPGRVRGQSSQQQSWEKIFPDFSRDHWSLALVALTNILIFVFVFKSGDNNIIYETFTRDILF